MDKSGYPYQFPEQDAYRASEVTEPEFDIFANEDYFRQLYVDFSEVRPETQFSKMRFILGMNEQSELVKKPNIFRKIIFSGHRGSGKTIELRRFHRQIDTPKGYMALYVNLEEETEIQRFEPEDLYIILISVLLRELNNRGVEIEHEFFQEIADEWLQDNELKKELTEEYGMSAEGGISIGWKFWEFLGVEGGYKRVFAQNNATTRTIRQKIKLNQINLINSLNLAFLQLRRTLEDQDKVAVGKDFMFIIDGLEKTQPIVHKTLFVDDVQLIYSLNVHLIACVPIQTYYESSSQVNAAFFERVYLPMMRVNATSIPLLKAIIDKRVDDCIFADDILENMVYKSGGCPRQLLHIAHRAIVDALGQQVTETTLAQTYKRMGNERWQTLTRKDKDIISSQHYDDAEPEILQMLFTLNLFEYNGDNMERKLNPLLKPFFKDLPQ